VEAPVTYTPRLFPGLTRYYDATGDWRAMEAAQGLARFVLSRKDEWVARFKKGVGYFAEGWSAEPFAMLYGLTGEKCWLDFVALIEEHLVPPERVHSHAYLSTLRGLQMAVLATEAVQVFRQEPKAAPVKSVTERY
jgi:DUF1680 family protein